MTVTTTPPTAADESHVPPLGDLLLRSAGGLRERTAIQALIEEERLLSQDNVRTALVTKKDGVMTCRWDGIAGRLNTLGLDEGGRAFLGLLLSIVGAQPDYLTIAAYLDERRLKIVLRAIVRLAGNDRIAVGTRL